MHNRLITNILLILFGLTMIFSGLTQQIGFHIGGPDRPHGENVHGLTQQAQYESIREIDTDKTVCGLNYHDWSATHKTAIVIFTLLMIYHTYDHWNWYKTLFRKKWNGRSRRVLILSVLFLLVAVTGIVPWIIDMSGGAGMIRMQFIEVHDKLALLLFVFIIIHVAGRLKWYSNALRKSDK